MDEYQSRISATLGDAQVIISKFIRGMQILSDSLKQATVESGDPL